MMHLDKSGETGATVVPRGRHITKKTSPVSVKNNDQLICVEKPSQNSASDDQ
jgi:hypothetical protein